MELDILEVIHIYGFVSWVSEYSIISKYWRGEGRRDLLFQMKFLPPCMIKEVNFTKKVKLPLYFNYIIKPCHEGIWWNASTDPTCLTSVIDGGE
jgi:hypothetical protein